MELKTKMVKGTLYRKSKDRAKKPVSEADIDRTDMLVTRSWAEDLNDRNDKDAHGIEYFEIDEKSTKKYYKDREIQEKEKVEIAQLAELDKQDLASTLLKMAVGKLKEDETK